MTEPDEPDYAANTDALQQAIETYAAENLGREGSVTGFVLFVATGRIDEDGDPVYAFNYTVGRQTDMMRAIGLVHICSQQMDHDMTSS